jgi:hypothetical protein
VKNNAKSNAVQKEQKYKRKEKKEKSTPEE